MATPLAVPTTLTNGNLYFAEVSADATAQDVIHALLAQEDLKWEALDGLPDEGFALQIIRSERHGRSWEKEELEALGDGACVNQSGFNVPTFKQGLSSHLPWLHLCSQCLPPRLNARGTSPRSRSQVICMTLSFV